MENSIGSPIARRTFLAGSLAGGVLLLPGCTSLGGFSMTEALKRLLTISSERAFAKLTAPGGFWDSEVARFDLPEMFSGSGGVLKGLLTSGAFKTQLQRQLNVVAEKGAERAAPLVLEAVRNISIPDAVGIIRGGPTAATTYLRGQMGPALVNAMVPGLGDALRLSSVRCWVRRSARFRGSTFPASRNRLPLARTIRSGRRSGLRKPASAPIRKAPTIRC